MNDRYSGDDLKNKLKGMGMTIDELKTQIHEVDLSDIRFCYSEISRFAQRGKTRDVAAVADRMYWDVCSLMDGAYVGTGAATVLDKLSRQIHGLYDFLSDKLNSTFLN
jgi:hypothetical protein